jgi:hypothetical protein
MLVSQSINFIYQFSCQYVRLIEKQQNKMSETHIKKINEKEQYSGNRKVV